MQSRTRSKYYRCLIGKFVFGFDIIGQGLFFGPVMEPCVLRLLSSGYGVVSREVYSRYVYIPRMLCVLSSLPQSDRETPLLVDFVAPCRRRRDFAPVQPTHLPLEAAAPDARNRIPALWTFCRCGLDIESKIGEHVWKT
jgi:hypothetical protein